jgi:hypothetical protein
MKSTLIVSIRMACHARRRRVLEVGTVVHEVPYQAKRTSMAGLTVLDAAAPAMARHFRDFHGVFSARARDPSLAQGPEGGQQASAPRLATVAALSRRYRAALAANAASVDEQLERWVPWKRYSWRSLGSCISFVVRVCATLQAVACREARACVAVVRGVFRFPKAKSSPTATVGRSTWATPAYLLAARRPLLPHTTVCLFTLQHSIRICLGQWGFRLAFARADAVVLAGLLCVCFVTGWRPPAPPRTTTLRFKP